MKLNLGCGHLRLPGYVNVDIDASLAPDLVANLNECPWPWPDNSADEIRMQHCLEHLDNPEAVIKELHRVLKPARMLTIMVPHFSLGGCHWQHKSFWTVESFSVEPFNALFGVRSRRLRWFRYGARQRKATTIGLPFEWLVNGLANLQPVVFERFFVFWVGGLEEIEFQLVKK